MKSTPTSLKGVQIIEPQVFGDNRGWFTETYSEAKFKHLGIHAEFVQDNHSMSTQKGTLRGLHFQKNPKGQAKLVRCIRGRILDVAVDLRRGSPTYKKWVGVELSEENKKQLFIPKGFAHGFVTLTEDVEIQYKVDEYYAPECDRSIAYNDPEISVAWGVQAPVLSKKDQEAPLLKDSDANFSVRVLVTGILGQLGYDVVKKLQSLNIEAIGTTPDDFDLTDPAATARFIEVTRPDVIIHCAAYTAVDKAEEERELCHAINVEGTRAIVESAKRIGATVVYISTDYVFDGTGTEPHPEAEAINAVNYYGYTKAQGEMLVREGIADHFIIRTSWVYGKNGSNFVKTMLKLAETRNELRVVSDQVGAPTYTRDLAEFIVALIQTEKHGTYHGVNEGYCSWYEFAREIFNKAGIDVNVLPVTTAEYPTKAKRPLNSRLSKQNTDMAGLPGFPDWKDALARFLDELKQEEQQ